MKEPILSIVIANYNYGHFLEDAILSVVGQDGFSECELIVVDGASADNSVAVIKKYENQISWWVSEKDKGQSDAFNKGFAHARGKYLTWLNADDILISGALLKIVRTLRRHGHCHWFTGNYLQFREDNRKIILAPWGPHFLPWFMHDLNAPLVIFGPTSFWSREAFLNVGPLDVSLHYSMDTDYWHRLKKAGYRQRRMNFCCWAFRMHEESKTAQYGGRKIKDEVRSKWYEELRIVRKKIGFCDSKNKKWLSYLFRVIDGSAFVALYRQWLLVGKNFDLYERRLSTN